MEFLGRNIAAFTGCTKFCSNISKNYSWVSCLEHLMSYVTNAKNADDFQLIARNSFSVGYFAIFAHPITHNQFLQKLTQPFLLKKKPVDNIFQKKKSTMFVKYWCHIVFYCTKVQLFFCTIQIRNNTNNKKNIIKNE